MQTEQYTNLTECEAEMINYYFFSVDGITRHLELVEMYKDSMDIDEIIRVEVRNEMFRVLSVDVLQDYFKSQGIPYTKNMVRAMKKIIKISDAEK